MDMAGPGWSQHCAGSRCHELQRTHTQQLESEVQQRTRELEEANRKLTALVCTGPLTGLLNRRQFETLIDEEIQRRPCKREPWPWSASGMRCSSSAYLMWHPGMVSSQVLSA